MKRLLLPAAIVAAILAMMLLNAWRSCETADAPVSPLEPQELRQAAGAAGPAGPTQPPVSYPTRTPRVTYLPNTKAVNDFIDGMNNAGMWKWYRSDIEFKIGFELYLKTCVREMPDDTMVDYILRFRRVDEDAEGLVGTIELDEINADMRERKVTDEQWARFRACATEYLLSHTWAAADYPNDTATWGSGTYFPIGGDPLYGHLKEMGVEIPGL